MRINKWNKASIRNWYATKHRHIIVIVSVAGGYAWFQPAATGNFHPDKCYALNVIGLNDLSELLTTIYTVQFRAADQSDLPFHKFLMQVCICKGCAVGSDQQLFPVKIRRIDRYQFDLAGPLSQLGCELIDWGQNSLFCTVKAMHLMTGTTRVRRSRRSSVLLFPFSQIFLYGIFIICRGFPFYEGNSVCRTSRQPVLFDLV